MELCSFLFCSSLACWLKELCDCCLKSTTQQSVSTWMMSKEDLHLCCEVAGQVSDLRSSPRTVFQIRHTTPHFNTESQCSTRPLHPRLSVSLVCMPSSTHQAWDGCGPQDLTNPSLLPPLPAAHTPIKLPLREVSFPITLPAPKPA